MGILALCAVACAAAASRGKGDRRLDGVAHFPWSNLATLLVPDHTVYNSTDAIHSKIEALMSTCKELTHEQSATAFRSAAINETQILRLTSPGTTNKTTVAITFGIHGREYVASEVGLAMIYKLCDGSARSARLLQHTTFIIFPVANVAGRKKMGTGMGKESSPYLCSEMRKNGNNVDLNRNFNVMWSDGSDDPAAEDYRGPAANSEPETILIDGVLRATKPDVYIDVHSGDTTMMYPYSYQDADCPDASKQQLLAYHAGKAAFGCSEEAMNVASARTELVAGAAPQPADDPTALLDCPKVGNSAEALSPPYLASGTTLDYAYVKLDIPYAFTWEVYSGTRFYAAQKGRTAANAADAAQKLTSSLAKKPRGDNIELTARLAEMDAVKPHPAVAAQHEPHKGRAEPHALLPGAAVRYTPLWDPHGTSLLSAEMSMEECFAYFNPTSSAELTKTSYQWSEAIMAAAEKFLS